MTIQQFKYVMAVVELKKFEDAAEKCFVTQSTLSTMIVKLENEIGVKIFNRKTKPVSITFDGEKIIDRIRILLNEVDSLEDIIKGIKGEMIGVLKIGIIPTIAPYLLPLFLTKLANRFPKINITVNEMTTAQIQNDLKSRLIDIGILALPLNDKELTELELYKEQFFVYDCRKTKSKTKFSANTIDYSKLLLLQEGHCLRSQVNQICEIYNQNTKSNNNFIFESGSMDSLLRFTEASEGITIIPHLTALSLNKEDSKNLIEFKTPAPARSIGLITHQFFVKKNIYSALQEIIQSKISKLLPETGAINIINPLN